MALAVERMSNQPTHVLLIEAFPERGKGHMSEGHAMTLRSPNQRAPSCHSAHSSPQCYDESKFSRGAGMICWEFVRVVTRKKARLVFVSLVAGLLSEGCLPPRREAFIIPTHCVKIGVESFTQPCTQRANGKLVCNGVVITANCVAPQSDRHR
jgi:hypothetical protein